MKRAILSSLIVLFALSGCRSNIYYNYDSTGYVPYDPSLDNFSDIDTLSIDWINGDISIANALSGNIIDFYEETNQYPLYYKVVNTTLNIKFARSGIYKDSFNDFNKELILVFGDQTTFKKVEIKSVNSNIKFMGDYKSENTIIDLVNGKLSFDYLRGKNVTISTVNANVEVDAAFSLYHYEGSEIVYDKNIINISSVSADAKICVPEIFGYKVSFSTISGKYSSEYEEDKKHEKGNKLVNVRFSSVSGDLKMAKPTIETIE